jgi:hypothetical protein
MEAQVFRTKCYRLVLKQIIFSVTPQNNISNARSLHSATQPLRDKVYIFYTLFGSWPRAGSRGENLMSGSVANVLATAFIAELPTTL